MKKKRNLLSVENGNYLLVSVIKNYSLEFDIHVNG